MFSWFKRKRNTEEAKGDPVSFRAAGLPIEPRKDSEHRNAQEGARDSKASAQRRSIADQNAVLLALAATDTPTKTATPDTGPSDSGSSSYDSGSSSSYDGGGYSGGFDGGGGF
jgi:hypothetical protein